VEGRGWIVRLQKGVIMPGMIPTTLMIALFEVLAAVPKIDPAPARSYVWSTVFQLLFLMACIGVSVKWTKKTHLD
jgi:hypothetical protein